MGFVANALGFNNSYTNTSGAGANTTAQQATDETTLANALAGQGTLAQQLQAQANGQGPNIANLQLQQATNQNNQNAAASLGSQRGMNPALAQRIISQQQATNNQNAAGQSGVLRAQQQLAAQGALGNVYAQQAQEGAQNLNTLTQAQTAANNSNAAAAGQNAQIGGGLVGGILGGGAAALGLAKGGKVTPEHHLSQMLISAGHLIKPKKYAFGTDDGGVEASYVAEDSAAGGGIDPSHTDTPASQLITQSYNGPDPANQVVDTANAVSEANPIQANAKKPGAFGTGFANATKGGMGAAMAPVASPAFANVPPPQLTQPNQISGLAPLLRAHGGKVPAMVSPGERFIPPQYVEAVKTGKIKASKVAPKFPGKAKVKGDSEENDNIPKSLEEGGVVVPRTKADNDSDAREFLQAIQADKKKKEGPSGYAKVLEARRKRSA